LAANPEIKQRIAELQAEARHTREVAEREADPGEEFSAAWCCYHLARLSHLAAEKRDFKTAIACVTDICKIKDIGWDQKKNALYPQKNHGSNQELLPLSSTINLSLLTHSAELPDNLRDDVDKKVVRLLASTT